MNKLFTLLAVAFLGNTAGAQPYLQPGRLASVATEIYTEPLNFWNTPAVVGTNTYKNPVIQRSVPDPTIIQDDKGFFYLYGTEDTRNVPIFKSKNLTTWVYIGTAFTDASRPTFVQNGGIWAPDINYINGKYVLYYSMSVWGGVETCGIGVATADSPRGPFTDHGKLFISNEIGVRNSIDPFYIEEEDGRKYLFWGSFNGIYGIELSDDGLSLKEGAVKKKIAGTLTEGTYIIKHDGYYYLIGSAGSCCEGLKSSYHLVMARSKRLFGPYVNKEGSIALTNSFSDLLKASNEVAGPGHNAEFIQDASGQYWVLYHGYAKANPELNRQVFLDKVYWDENGWPYITNMQPSVEEAKPVFATTGIDEVEDNSNLNSGVEISPRMVKENLTIADKSGKRFSWRIASLSGELIKSGNGTGRVTVDCYDVPEGMYVVTMKNHAGKSSVKIVRY